MLLNLIQLLAHVAAYLYGVGAGLLGDDEPDCLTAVRFLIKREVLDRILDGGDIANEDLLSGRGHRDHQILYLRTLDVLGAHLHLVLLLRHFDRTRREVEVIRRNDITHLLKRQAVGIQFLLVDINIDITVRRSRKGYVSYSVHLVELRDDLVVHDLVQSGVGLIGRDRILRYRHGRGRELEDHRRSAVVR